MNAGIKKTILEGDDHAVRSALKHEWDLDELRALCDQAKKITPSENWRIHLIASRISQILSK